MFCPLILFDIIIRVFMVWVEGLIFYLKWMKLYPNNQKSWTEFIFSYLVHVLIGKSLAVTSILEALSNSTPIVSSFRFLSQMNEILFSPQQSKVLEENIFFMFWSAKVVLLIDSLWHHHHHKRWEPLWVRRRKSICHLFPIIKTFGSFIVLCGGYFCLPNKRKIENEIFFCTFFSIDSLEIRFFVISSSS